MLTYDLALQVAGRTPQWQEDYRRQGWRINAHARCLATQRCSVCCRTDPFAICSDID